MELIVLTEASDNSRDASLAINEARMKLMWAQDKVKRMEKSFDKLLAYRKSQLDDAWKLLDKLRNKAKLSGMTQDEVDDVVIHSDNLSDDIDEVMRELVVELAKVPSEIK